MATTGGRPRTAEAPTPPETGLGGRRKRRPERHTDILLAAVDLFHRQDYHSTTLDQIADQVGVSPAAVYRHFRNKQAILDAAATWTTDLLYERLGDGRNPDGSLPTVTEMVDTASQGLAEIGAPASILDRHLHALSPEVRDACTQRTRPYVQTWIAVVGDLRPELTPAEREAAVHGTLAVLTSAARIGLDVGAVMPILREMALAALLP